jgi:hypothetical protein
MTISLHETVLGTSNKKSYNSTIEEKPINSSYMSATLAMAVSPIYVTDNQDLLSDDKSCQDDDCDQRLVPTLK